MFIQTVLQHLLGKKKKAQREAKPIADKELSPMAQSIMQKLAEHEKNAAFDPKTDHSAKNEGNK
jgi:hypothetical protein